MIRFDPIVAFRQSRAARIGRWGVIFLACILGPSAAFPFADPDAQRAAGLVAACVVLWLAQLVPVFVPTLLLLTLAPILLSETFTASRVLGWAVDPVLPLFFGGLAMGAAAERHGLAENLAQRVVAWSRGDRRRLVTLAMLITALLSMWLSNTAAATLMLATLVPLADRLGDGHLRRAILLAVAAGANLGGLATPIGTAPNALALSQLGDRAPSFLAWMSLGLPLALVMLLIARGVILHQTGIAGRIETAGSNAQPTLDGRGRLVAAIIGIAVVLWLSEPLHGIDAATVAIGLAAACFASGLLERQDLQNFDWGTLLLISGGIAMGRMLDQTGMVALLTEAMPWDTVPGWSLATAALALTMICSAVLSNTATATLILTAMAGIAPDRPELAIVLVLGSSLSFPFAVSTPPNAMVAGLGVGSRDLMRLGILLLVLGLAILGTVGPTLAGLILR